MNRKWSRQSHLPNSSGHLTREPRTHLMGPNQRGFMTNLKSKKYYSFASYLTIILTFVLFVVALFEKGFTHDMLLEAGVFLVSVKLILGAHRQQMDLQRIEKKIDALK